jgi:hypothetical protein
MFSEKCKLQGLKGIKQLDRFGAYLVIANRRLFETGDSSRYTLVNEKELWVDSIHSIQDAALTLAQKLSQ